MGPLLVPPFREGDITMKTQKICVCGDLIVFTQEIVLLQVVELTEMNGTLMLQPVEIREGEFRGDFAWEPYYVEFSPCWEKIEEWLEEQLEDSPPLDDLYSRVNCHYCKSGIRVGEYCGSITMGEFHINLRSPNGHKEDDFKPAGYPAIICLYCLLLINDGNMEFWDPEEGGISQQGECGDCTRARCWRSPPEACNCMCHHDEDFEKEERE